MNIQSISNQASYISDIKIDLFSVKILQTVSLFFA